MSQTGLTIDDDGAISIDYESDPRLQVLLGPGCPFQTRTTTIGGVAQRTFVNAPRTIQDVFRIAAAHGDLTHLVMGDERITFTDLRRRALTIAAHLGPDFDVRPGDRVAIAMRNLPEFIESYWAAIVLGAVVVPLNSWWTGAELHHGLRSCEATVVFADQERVECLTAENQPCPVPIIGVRCTPAAGVVPLETLLTGDPLAESDYAAVDPDDPAMLIFTSGTTGRAKGAVATHRNAITSIMNMGFASAREALLSGRPPAPPRQAASISAGPLFHVGGVATIIGGAMSGAKIALMHKWDAGQAIALAAKEEVTSFGGVPTMTREVLEHPATPSLVGLVRSMPMGGASVPPELPRRVTELFGDTVQILNGYGTTETMSAVATNVGTEYRTRPDSVGRVNLTTELRVTDPDGNVLGVGEIGELCFRSPQLTRGYWNEPDATAASFVDGWFHTGDLGYIDADGYLYVVDRLKDTIIRGGENVHCIEVEAVLFEHPSVLDVAVIGLPDQLMGERVCAVVVPRKETRPGLADIRDFAATRLAKFECPEALFLTQDLPRTATGKVAKKALRAILAEHPDQIQRS